MKVIIEYPDDFPILEPLRTVFTERLYLLFDAHYVAWSMSHSELLEKLFVLRHEMQKSIGYPPVISHLLKTHPADPLPAWLPPSGKPVMQGSPVPESIDGILSLEELLCWKNIEFRFLNDLPPDARDAGLEMASRILGIHIYYGETDNTAAAGDTALDVFRTDNHVVTQATASKIVETLTSLSPALSDGSMTPEIAPLQLCPFSIPKRIGTLTKYWSHEDRKRLTHTIKHHIEVVALGAFVIGLVFGFLIDTTDMLPATRICLVSSLFRRSHIRIRRD
ncbi:hypothetical protein NRY68_16545 [Acidithiobacillus ferrooxidans]|uniref:hypothetical protein n=1 Tax=Acidithiobacillus ferrooxidans TaxID=920 RepID=UPI00214827BD|nr:hypothetical protein [Acidithiobacillus ferrooxidans]MCR1347360.1 hypothetical protein [Acidithiobacillus ferrooxidans]MCR1354779.1 hypothetical protein [Acidithiobacillus ferrooxidans]